MRGTERKELTDWEIQAEVNRSEFLSDLFDRADGQAKPRAENECPSHPGSFAKPRKYRGRIWYRCPSPGCGNRWSQ